MKISLVSSLVVLALALASLGCDNKTSNPAPATNPLGGPINFGGQPSQSVAGPTSSSTSAPVYDPNDLNKPKSTGGDGGK